MSTGARSDRNGAYFQAIVPGNAQTLSYANVSLSSLQFAATTTLVRLFSNQDCYVAFGPNPTAAVPLAGAIAPRTIFLAGGIYEYVGVNPGEFLAVIRKTNSGFLEVTEAL